MPYCDHIDCVSIGASAVAIDRAPEVVAQIVSAGLAATASSVIAIFGLTFAFYYYLSQGVFDKALKDNLIFYFFLIGSAVGNYWWAVIPVSMYKAEAKSLYPNAAWMCDDFCAGPSFSVFNLFFKNCIEGSLAESLSIYAQIAVLAIALNWLIFFGVMLVYSYSKLRGVEKFEISKSDDRQPCIPEDDGKV